MDLKFLILWTEHKHWIQQDQWSEKDYFFVSLYRFSKKFRETQRNFAYQLGRQFP